MDSHQCLKVSIDCGTMHIERSCGSCFILYLLIIGGLSKIDRNMESCGLFKASDDSKYENLNYGKVDLDW